MKSEALRCGLFTFDRRRLADKRNSFDTEQRRPQQRPVAVVVAVEQPLAAGNTAPIVASNRSGLEQHRPVSRQRRPQHCVDSAVARERLLRRQQPDVVEPRQLLSVRFVAGTRDDNQNFVAVCSCYFCC